MSLHDFLIHLRSVVGTHSFCLLDACCARFTNDVLGYAILPSTKIEEAKEFLRGIAKDHEIEYVVVDDLPGVSIDDPDRTTKYAQAILDLFNVAEVYTDRFHVHKRTADSFNHYSEHFYSLICVAMRDAIVQRSATHEKAVDAALKEGLIEIKRSFQGEVYVTVPLHLLTDDVHLTVT